MGLAALQFLGAAPVVHAGAAGHQKQHQVENKDHCIENEQHRLNLVEESGDMDIEQHQVVRIQQQRGPGEPDTVAPDIHIM